MMDLVAGLPPTDSAYWRAVHGGQQPWGPTEFLIRNLVYAQTRGKWEILSPQERRSVLLEEQALDERLLMLEAKERRRHGN